MRPFMDSSVLSPWNLTTIEEAHARWKKDPNSVDESWQHFFQGFDLGMVHQTGSTQPEQTKNAAAPTIRLIDAYRELGHMLAHLDPLSDPPQTIPLLELPEFGLREDDLDRQFDTS